MKLTLERGRPGDGWVCGKLLVDGQFECFTLEDMPRPGMVKVPGQTAIPEGTYQVIVNYSTRFHQLMPLLLNVPGFTGIRIHSGNSAADTEGCILLGGGQSPGWVGQSRIAFGKFFPKLEAALEKGEKVFIEVKSEGGK